jgi:hypothetical protein
MIEIGPDNVEDLVEVFKKFNKIHEYAKIRINLTEPDLLSVLDQSRGRKFFGELSELVIGHPMADDEVFARVFEYSDGDREILNALATSGRCPATIIETLVKSRIRSVSEHARINRLSRSIGRMSEDEIARLLLQHDGDGHLDTGIRATIAISDETPVAILDRLARDDVDSIAQQAQETLGRRQRGSP